MASEGTGASRSPYSGSAALPPGSAPRPSPSLSPSIVSLLNAPQDLETPFDHDYFGGGTASTHEVQQQPRPRSSHKRPRPTSSSSSTGSPSLGGTASLDHVLNGAGIGTEEEEGAMEPPATRLRRSSSISSATSAAAPAPAPPPPPPPAPLRRSSSPSRPTTAPAPAPGAGAGARPAPPPPPPAPAPAPAPAPPAPTRRGSDLRLEPSIFNVEPIDEFTREVADWLWGFCAPLDWDRVEIEAKIGLLVDSRAGGTRVSLPVPIETILTDDTGLRFESNMTVNQHKAFNRLLNSRVEESAHASYLSAPVRYAHTREIDTFHEVSVPGQGRRKVRVTRDQKDRSKVHAVEKMRVADMNVFSPKRRFDWRVSVSLEMPAPVPDTPPTHSRAKDRISYSHQLFQVDLTQVTSGAAQAKGAAGPTHELEIEVRKARPLLEEAAKEQRGEENRYLEMVQGLLNNVRMLIRNASDP